MVEFRRLSWRARIGCTSPLPRSARSSRRWRSRSRPSTASRSPASTTSSSCWPVRSWRPPCSASRSPPGSSPTSGRRKWSVIVGHLGIGVGLLIEASVPSVAGVLSGQIVWGIAYTFTSGATVAWLTAELEEPDRVALTRVVPARQPVRVGRCARRRAVGLPARWVVVAPPDRHRRRHLRRAGRVADDGDERAPLRAGVGPRHMARARPHGRGGRAGDPVEPGPRDGRRRHLPRRRGERGVRPLQREVPARRHRPACMAGMVRADVDGGDRLHCRRRSAWSCRGGSNAVTGTSTSRHSGGGSSGSWSSRSPAC